MAFLAARLSIRVLILARIAFVLCLLAVLYGLFRPQPPAALFEHSDKFGHLIAFFALALTGRIASYHLSPRLFWPAMLLLAVVLEYLQGALVPSRFFSLGDIAANLGGVVLALVSLWIAGRLVGRISAKGA